LPKKIAGCSSRLELLPALNYMEALPGVRTTAPRGDLALKKVCAGRFCSGPRRRPGTPVPPQLNLLFPRRPLGTSRPTFFGFKRPRRPPEGIRPRPLDCRQAAARALELDRGARPMEPPKSVKKKKTDQGDCDKKETTDFENHGRVPPLDGTAVQCNAGP